jgi:hypothetical protein
MVVIGQGRVGPRLVCDQCLGVIEKTSEASAEWRSSDVPKGAPIFFTHNACTRAFRAARGGQAGWQWARIEDLKFWLAKNLGMRVEVSPGEPLKPYRILGELFDLGSSGPAG